MLKQVNVIVKPTMDNVSVMHAQMDTSIFRPVLVEIIDRIEK